MFDPTAEDLEGWARRKVEQDLRQTAALAQAGQPPMVVPPTPGDPFSVTGAAAQIVQHASELDVLAAEVGVPFEKDPTAEQVVALQVARSRISPDVLAILSPLRGLGLEVMMQIAQALVAEGTIQTPEPLANLLFWILETL